MNLLKLHQLLPTTDDSYKEHEVIVNLDNVSYFHPTLDGKYTILMFDADNRLMVAETLDKIAGDVK